MGGRNDAVVADFAVVVVVVAQNVVSMSCSLVCVCQEGKGESELFMQANTFTLHCRFVASF